MTETSSPDSGSPSERAWDPAEVMRDRAAATRRDRDEAIAELRATLSDDQIMDDFGIDLGEIER